MKVRTHEHKKILIVSQTLHERIPISELPYECIVSKNIKEEINNRLEPPPNRIPLLLVLCLSLNEYIKHKNILHAFRTSDLLYTVCVQTTRTDNYSLLFDDTHIAYLWQDIPKKQMLRVMIHNAFCQLEEKNELIDTIFETEALLHDMKQDQEDLINIGRNLSIEKNPQKLLRLILALSKKITGADAGSIYLIEKKGEKKKIRFKCSHTFSKHIQLDEFTIPFDISSIAGYVAVTGKVLNIPDVYALSKKDPISFNKSIDQRYDYRSKSMLLVPMRNHIDQIIGVIQLINSKENYKSRTATTGNEAFEIRLATPEDFDTKVFPFDPRYESLMEAVAGQAAISIENNRLIKQLQQQFEEFVKAAVIAIDSRDPATSGHSIRVAEICTFLARLVNKTKQHPFDMYYFTDTEIKELNYAALLHDFGKVYIDLAIFMKARKLFPKELENLMLKMNYLYRMVERKYILEEQNLQKQVTAHTSKKLREKLKKEQTKILKKIKDAKEKIKMLNEPNVLDSLPEKILNEIDHEILDLECDDIDGNSLKILTDYEKTNLCIKRGCLNAKERREIESHVIHTYNFVSRIPWPPEYHNIPQIARMHHEKLDGSGYPDGKKGKEIPLQARIMTIADIYDALTARDRPYKKAVSHAKAIKILINEAEAGKLDRDLVNLITDSEAGKQLVQISSKHKY
jgi:HD-GYP domain-containing protein (c-di-GMP phosphodiesterase class II)